MFIKKQFFLVLMSCLGAVLNSSMNLSAHGLISAPLLSKNQKILNRKLFFTVLRNNHQEFEQLLVSGAQINVQDDKGRTVLHIAASLEFIEIIKIALRFGAEVNAKNRWNSTPLHRAVSYKRKNAMRVLIAAGTDLKIQDTSGMCARDLANEDMKNVIDQTRAEIERITPDVETEVRQSMHNELDQSDASSIPQAVIGTILMGFLEEDIQERVRDALIARILREES